MLEQLSFLAGLLHDAGKARPAWQDYLRRSVANEKGLETLPHAYVGTVLFAIYARGLLDDSPATEITQHYLLLIQDLQDHHGKLRDRDESPQPVPIPWKESIKNYPPIDVFFADLDKMVKTHFTAINVSIKNYRDFSAQLTQLEQNWGRAYKTQHRKLHEATNGNESAYASWICRDGTGRLIAADRLSASSSKQSEASLTPEKAKEALEKFRLKLEAKYQKAVTDGYQTMADKRQKVQEQVFNNYLAHQHKTWFTLNLPVGWGKTLASLRIALEHASTKGSQRIIYVAPYLAILTQAAKEIREVTELEVLEHHHLAVLSNAKEQKSAGKKEAVEEKREPIDILTMESWQAPIIATTFNQLFRAIFPASAQQTIRIPSLQNTFIIIDEPQIINSSVYNGFLRGLEVLCERLNATAMLITATLPPTVHGLGQTPQPLAPPVESANRYQLVIHDEPWNETKLVEEARERLKNHKQVAIILNTIADAVNVFQLARKETEADICLNLHGMMTPLHKAYQISTVARQLGEKKPVLAVSTQVLEAGVDLSFRHLLRAKPILSSIVQAAGRANRHAEGDRATVEIFSFVRESGFDMRKVIYKNEHQRRLTDELLMQAHEWSEEKASQLIEKYYEELSIQDANIGILKRFKSAAEGKWSKLAGLNPFETIEEDDGDESILERNASVFVVTPDTWLTPLVKYWMNEFKIIHVHDIYEHYQDIGFMKKLEFPQRKRFLSLLKHFVAPLRWRLVPQICGRTEDYPAILRVQNDGDYHSDTGFGHLLSRKDFDTFETQLEARMNRSYDPNVF